MKVFDTRQLPFFRTETHHLGPFLPNVYFVGKFHSLYKFRFASLKRSFTTFPLSHGQELSPRSRFCPHSRTLHLKTCITKNTSIFSLPFLQISLLAFFLSNLSSCTLSIKTSSLTLRYCPQRSLADSVLFTFQLAFMVHRYAQIRWWQISSLN